MPIQGCNWVSAEDKLLQGHMMRQEAVNRA
jgi:hypothetical protein